MSIINLILIHQKKNQQYQNCVPIINETVNQFQEIKSRIEIAKRRKQFSCSREKVAIKYRSVTMLRVCLTLLFGAEA